MTMITLVGQMKPRVHPGWSSEEEVAHDSYEEVNDPEVRIQKEPYNSPWL